MFGLICMLSSPSCMPCKSDIPRNQYTLLARALSGSTWKQTVAEVKHSTTDRCDGTAGRSASRQPGVCASILLGLSRCLGTRPAPFRFGVIRGEEEDPSPPTQVESNCLLNQVEKQDGSWKAGAIVEGQFISVDCSCLQVSRPVPYRSEAKLFKFTQTDSGNWG